MLRALYEAKPMPVERPDMPNLTDDQRDALAILALKHAPEGPLKMFQDMARYAIHEYRKTIKPKTATKTTRSRADAERKAV